MLDSSGMPVNWSLVTPKLAHACMTVEAQMVNEGKWPALTFIFGLRSWEVQADLYAAWHEDRNHAIKVRKIQTRPAPAGVSWHNPGQDGKAWAVDIDADPKAAAKPMTEPQERLVVLMRAQPGIVAGADWDDNVHFQIQGYDRWENYRVHAKKHDAMLMLTAPVTGANGGSHGNP